MVKLRRIGPFSAARFGFFFGLAAVLAQVMVLLVILTFNGIPPTQLPPEIWMEILRVMFLSGAFTAFSFFVFSIIYNWSSDIFGALELEFEMPMATVEAEKAKNGMFDED